jgi:hypothetical protein
MPKKENSSWRGFFEERMTVNLMVPSCLCPAVCGPFAALQALLAHHFCIRSENKKFSWPHFHDFHLLLGEKDNQLLR